MRPSSKRMLQSGRSLASDWSKIKSAFSDTAEDVKEVADDMFEQSVGDMKNKSKKIQDDVADFTAQKPIKALAIAALAGFVLGCWWKR